MTKSEAGKLNALKRWHGNIAPTGVPYRQQTPEERRAYHNLMQRQYRARVGRSDRQDTIKILQAAPENVVNQAMRLWR